MDDLNKSLLETFYFFKNNVLGIFNVIFPLIFLQTLLVLFLELFIGENDFFQFISMGILFGVYPIYQGAVIYYIASISMGERLTVKHCYQLAIRNWLPLIVFYTFSSALMILGLLMLVVPGLIVFSRVSFGEFYCLFEKNKGLEAISTSWDNTRKLQWFLLKGMLIIYSAIIMSAWLLEYVLKLASLWNEFFDVFVSFSTSALSVMVTIFAFRIYMLNKEQ